MNWEKFFIGSFLFLTFAVGTFFLFQWSPVVWTYPNSSEFVDVSFAEILFVVISWLVFLLGAHFRLFNLISLLIGQLSLLYLFDNLVVFTYELPTYALIGINGFYLLLLYFFFSTSKWAPYSIEDELKDKRS